MMTARRFATMGEETTRALRRNCNAKRVEFESATVVMAHRDGHDGQTRPRRCGAAGYQRATARHPICILGIDPGLRRTGWGLIESDGNRLIHIACGSLGNQTTSADLGARLLAIHDGLIAVIERYQPHEAAVEATFVNSNAAATPQARAGARHRHAGAGQGRADRCRIRA